MDASVRLMKLGKALRVKSPNWSKGSQAPVTVTNPNGESLRFSLPMFGNLKQAVDVRISEAWKIPISCQRVLHKGQPVGEEQVVRDLVSTDGGVHLTLEIATEDLARQLDDGAATSERSKALGDICLLGKPYGTFFAQRVLEILQDSALLAEKVLAINALGAICDEGDDDIVGQLKKRLRDPDGSIHSAALRALGMLCSPVDTVMVVDWALENAKSPDFRVRAAAITALATNVEQGNPPALAVVFRGLEDAVPAVRESAIQALTICNHGDQRPLNILAWMITEDTEVSKDCRSHIAEAIGRMAPRRHEASQAALLEVLSERKLSAEVYASALRALAHVAVRGDPDAYGSAYSAAKSEATIVRVAALQLVGQTAPKNCVWAIHLLFGELQHSPSAQIRSVACRALALISKRGRQDVMDVLETALADCDPEVQRSALEAMQVVGH